MKSQLNQGVSPDALQLPPPPSLNALQDKTSYASSFSSLVSDPSPRAPAPGSNALAGRLAALGHALLASLDAPAEVPSGGEAPGSHGALDRAKACFTASLTLRPEDNSSALLGLGLVLQTQGRVLDAIGVLRRARAGAFTGPQAAAVLFDDSLEHQGFASVGDHGNLASADAVDRALRQCLQAAGRETDASVVGDGAGLSTEAIQEEGPDFDAVDQRIRAGLLNTIEMRQECPADVDPVLKALCDELVAHGDSLRKRAGRAAPEEFEERHRLYDAAVRA